MVPLSPPTSGWPIGAMQRMLFLVSTPALPTSLTTTPLHVMASLDPVCKSEVSQNRWISWHFLSWEPEGITCTSPCCLLICQYPHQLTFSPSSFYGEKCYVIYTYMYFLQLLFDLASSPPSPQPHPYTHTHTPVAVTLVSMELLGSLKLCLSSSVPSR